MFRDPPATTKASCFLFKSFPRILCGLSLLFGAMRVRSSGCHLHDTYFASSAPIFVTRTRFQIDMSCVPCRALTLNASQLWACLYRPEASACHVFRSASRLQWSAPRGVVNSRSALRLQWSPREVSSLHFLLSSFFAPEGTLGLSLSSRGSNKLQTSCSTIPKHLLRQTSKYAIPLHRECAEGIDLFLWLCLFSNARRTSDTSEAATKYRRW